MKIKTKNLILLAGAIFCAALASGQAQTTFTKIIDGDIVNDRGQFASGAWWDSRSGGLLDLLVCNFGGTNILYRNNGDGTFTKITQGDPVKDAGEHVGPGVADLDNDGYLDLLVTVASGRNRLYHGNGDGTFSPISGGGVTNVTGSFNACAVADYDNDGLVDLFIPGYDATSQLFHNNGDSTFSRILSGPPGNTSMENTSVSWADYDNDGFMDLLVNGAAHTSNYLYHNNRNGNFTRILTNAVATDAWSDSAWGSAWGDYDNDGLLDLFVTGMEMGNRLYHNNGDGAFTNVTSGPMLPPPPGGGSRACAWGDYDNDGYLDLFVCGYNATNRLFHNNGNGTFTQILTGNPVNENGAGIYYQSCGWADYDNDGFLDLFVPRWIESGTPISNLLYHNDGNTNSWLEVKLVGTVANRSAIGAKVRVHATVGGKTVWQLREIISGGGRWIQPLVAHFGLGDATNVDALRIEWPSGIVQTLTNVAAKQFLTVTEHQEPGVAPSPITFTSVSRSTNGVVNLSVTGDTGLLYLLEGSTNLINWTWLGVRTNLAGNIQFSDTKATNISERFYRVSVP